MTGGVPNLFSCSVSGKCNTLSQGSSDHLTKHGARGFKQRWDAVNAAESQELAFLPVTQKFRQLEALLASANPLVGFCRPSKQ